MANLACRLPSALVAPFTAYPDEKAIQDTQINLYGVGDNIPAGNSLWIEVGTTTGVYTMFGPLGPGMVGNNTVGQQVQNLFTQADGIVPSTLYFVRVTERVNDNGVNPGTLVDASAECTFTTKAGNATTYIDCHNSGSSALDRNKMFVSITNGPWNLATAGAPFYGIEYSTSALGPWTVANLYDNDLCTNTGNPQGFAFPGSLAAMGDLLHNTTYFYRVTYNKGNGQPDEVHICGGVPAPTFNDIGGLGFNTTYDFPEFECQASPDICQTTASLNYGTTGGPGVNGGFPYVQGTNSDPCDVDSFVLRYGTTPGGPYPFSANFDNPPTQAFNFQPHFSLVGLTPNQQYCAVMDAIDNGYEPGVYSTSDECCFMTQDFVTALCDPATLITTNSATLNGNLDNPPAGYFWRFSYGTTPGGPYPNSTPSIVATGAEGPISANIASLTQGTTYYYIVETFTDLSAPVCNGNSGECSFVTLAGTAPDCAAATNITSNSATFNGVLHNATPGDLYNFEWGTTLGGPYPFATAPQGVAVGGDPEPISSPSGPLPTGTTIYFRVRQADSGNNDKFFSGECSFATPLAPTASCIVAQNITETTADLQYLISSSNFPGWNFVIRYGTVPGGPYPNSVGPFPITSDPEAGSKPIAGLTQGTTYYWIVEVRDGGNVVQDTSSECNFQTIINPATVVTDPATDVTSNCATFNATSTDAPAGCSYFFDYGTAPGGPYPNTVAATAPGPLSTGASPEAYSATVCGLIPGTQYYYRARMVCGGNQIPGNEQTFITTDIIYDPCEPATAITPFSATLHATALNVPAGYSYRFRYGTTPGGPYPFTVPGVPAIATGASPEAYQANIVGLNPGTTYYYTAETLNPAQQVVASGGECTFATVGAIGPDGFVYWCGQLYDSAECTFVPDNAGSYYGDDGVPNGYYNCNDF